MAGSIKDTAPVTIRDVGFVSARLSVIVSTLGNYETLARVLRGFGEQTADRDDFEVLVVMDAADPQPEEVNRAIDASGIRHVRHLTGPQPGLSANRNTGLEEARSPLLLFTDNDTIPHSDLVARHLSWHESYPEPEVGVQGHVRWSPEIPVTTFMRWLDMGTQFDFATIQGVDAGWGRFAGANVSVKATFARSVGPFDQEHFPYGYEDLDWAYRASQLGFRLLYDKKAVVDHFREMTLEFWQKRSRRVAFAERTFHALHPEVAPWFYGIFCEARKAPPARGRGIALAPYIPAWVPWIGRRVWRSVDMAYKQAIAPHFLAAWEEWTEDYSGGPDLTEFADGNPGGSSPAGPK